MFENREPVFETKRLLKKEMLESLRDFPRDFFWLKYETYSDGILTGCEIKGTENGFVILPGILCYRGVPYFLKKPYFVSCKANGRLTYIKVHFWDKEIGAGEIKYLSQIIADECETDTKEELELGRFKLQPGARLRSEYTDFYDYETEFDTVNRIFVPYAAFRHTGIWFEILKSFASQMIKQSGLNSLDYAFCFQCLQLKEAMAYEAVRAYLNLKLEQQKEYSNSQVYEALKYILRQTNEKKEEKRFREKKEGTLLML